MNILFDEQKDAGRDGNYPFTDRSTLMSSSGIQLDPGLVIDAAVHLVGRPLHKIPAYLSDPLVTIPALDDRGLTEKDRRNYRETVHISRIDFNARYLVLSSGAAAVATGTWDPDGTCMLYSVEIPDRKMGIVLLDGSKLDRGGNFTFEASATTLLPTVVQRVEQSVLRSIRTSGGEPMTGDVKIKGTGDVFFTIGYQQDQRVNVFLSVLSGFFSGDAQVDQQIASEDCDDRRPITSIGIVSDQKDFVVSQLGGASNVALIDTVRGLTCPGVAELTGIPPGTASEDICEDNPENVEPPAEPEPVSFTLQPRAGSVILSPGEGSPVSTQVIADGRLSLQVYGPNNSGDAKR